MFMTQSQGWVEVITGCMFSGKSEELIRRVRRVKIAKQKVLLFKPEIDNRYDPNSVVSHSGEKLEAIVVKDSRDIMKYVREHVLDSNNGQYDFQVMAIDEIQFFDEGIIGVCQHYANNGKRVIVAGLDKDFRGNPFGSMPALLAIAEMVKKVHAICMSCGNPASFSMKKKTADSSETQQTTQIQIGSGDIYEPRCRSCFVG